MGSRVTASTVLASISCNFIPDLLINTTSSDNGSGISKDGSSSCSPGTQGCPDDKAGPHPLSCCQTVLHLTECWSCQGWCWRNFLHPGGESSWSLTMLVLSCLVMTSSSRKAMSSREPELLWTSLSDLRSLVVLLTLWENLLMARAPLDARTDTELVSRLLVLSPDNLSRSPCRPVSRLLTVWCPLVEARES